MTDSQEPRNGTSFDHMTGDLTSAFLSSAKDLLGSSGWSEDADKLADVAKPWRKGKSGHTPFLARPASTEEAAALVTLCSEHRVAITPQGGNTGLVDGGIPHGEICVSMTRMNRVRSLDVLNNSLVIEAGATLFTAQTEAAKVDRLFPLSLGSEGIATIGGLISTNAGGVAVLRYGMMRDLILGLEVVLPSGKIWDGLSGLRKNNTGYDLKHLFAGAEGTLGLITAATLKLFPAVQTATAWITCKSAEQVTELLSHVRSSAGDTVTSFEIIPKNAVEMVCSEEPDIRDPLKSDLPWRVLAEISTSDAMDSQERLEKALSSAAEEKLAEDVLIAMNEAQAKDFWKIRETIPLVKRAFVKAIAHDVSVPVSAIPAFLEACEVAVLDVLPKGEVVAFGHVGDGNLHYSVCEAKDAEPPQLFDKSNEITTAVHRVALEYGGSISAEHGVGRLKRDELVNLRSPAATESMIAIKAALDPLGIMNPGRVVPYPEQ
ncbi:MAG: FAD-binding oxidoreductase [Pseudomonadota bacterium]